jgi:hypothetical protein
LIKVVAGADFFAGMMADPAANTGKGVIFFKKRQRFAVFALINQGDIALDADMGRASCLARRRAALADPKSPGDRLGVLFINCFAIGQALVILIGQGNGTYFNALATAGAFCQVYETRLLVDGSREVPRKALKIQQFGIG